MLMGLTLHLLRPIESRSHELSCKLELKMHLNHPWLGYRLTWAMSLETRSHPSCRPLTGSCPSKLAEVQRQIEKHLNQEWIESVA